MDKVFLIGLPSSGKTTLGKKVADAQNLTFIDMDDEIERLDGRTISEIFATEGENYFRQKERDVLKSLLNKKGKFLISTGGGAPCFFDNMKKIKEGGYSIYLKVSPQELSRRLSNKGLSDRPLLSDVQDVEREISAKLAKRSSYYEQADTTLEGDHIQVNDLLNAIKYAVR